MSSTTTIVSRNDAQPVEVARPDEREHAEREGGVGRHRDAPAVRGRSAGVDGEVDRDRHRPSRRSPASSGSVERPPLAQLAQVELAPRLEPDDEEEERHQAAVHPLAQRPGRARAADADRQRRLPDALVRASGRRSPRRGRRAPRRAAPRRRPSRCAGTAAAASACSAPRPCGRTEAPQAGPASARRSCRPSTSGGARTGRLRQAARQDDAAAVAAGATPTAVSGVAALR